MFELPVARGKDTDTLSLQLFIFTKSCLNLFYGISQSFVNCELKTTCLPVFRRYCLYINHDFMVDVHTTSVHIKHEQHGFFETKTHFTHYSENGKFKKIFFSIILYN